MKLHISLLLFLVWSIGSQAQSTSTLSAGSQSKTAEVYRVVENMPEYTGGLGEQMKFISQNIVYPKIAIDSAYSGNCYIRFVVDTAGYVKEAQVLKGVPKCPECDQEALRVIKLMPRWKPGKQNGKAVNVYYQIPVSFRLQ